MGHQSLSPVGPREVEKDLRSLAETVWRLMHRDSSQAALRMIGQALHEGDYRYHSPADRRAYLLNLRGIVYAQQQRQDRAQEDLTAATREAPGWHVPWYNLGLCHKHARRWREALTALQTAARCLDGRLVEDPGARRAVLWNQGIAETALEQWEAARKTWRACGLPVPAGPPGSATDLDLGLAQLSLPTEGPYAAERVWVQRICPARARILSVVRYGAPCQFGDIVLCDGGQGHTGYCDGVVASDGLSVPAGGEPRDAAMTYLDVVVPAGYVLHVIEGEPATAAQATALTERLRESEMHIEVWSLTMRLPDDDPAARSEGKAVPLCAGLVLPVQFGDSQRGAERAVSEVLGAAHELGLHLYAPSLLRAAGDELGAARHRRALHKRR